MSRYFIFLILFFCLLQPLSAQTEFCPSVADIQSGSLTYFLPLYKDNEELAMSYDVQTFRQHVTTFVAARWDHDYAENGHCFYQGTDPILNRIVYANDAWRPEPTQKWTWTRPTRLAECYSDNVHDCGFIQ